MKTKWIIPFVIVAVIVVQLIRPIPALQVHSTVNSTYTIPGQLPAIHWPETGEAALAVDGIGMIGQAGPNTPIPIASVTKVMTAYLTLQKHPLTSEQSGPALTVMPDDVDLYEKDKVLDESLVPVTAGETLTEREMLEALLLPSANNVAAMLAKWDAGSVQDFVSEMNETAKKLRMTHTHFADASGFNPESVSTAEDQIKMVETAMQIPVFRDIVRMPQATIPVAGTIYNVDYVLGKSGIIGVKTGSTDQAGGCFVFAANDTVNGKTYRIVGAVLGQQGDQPLMTALNDAVTLVQDARNVLSKVTVMTKEQPVVQLHAPWGPSAQGVTDQAATLVGWPGMEIRTQFHAANLGKQVQQGAPIGTLELSAGDQHVSVPVHAMTGIEPPSCFWRLIHG